MAPTAIDVGQSDLNQCVVSSQAPADFEDEKAGFTDIASSDEEKPSNVWQPQNAAYPFPLEPDEVEETHQLTLRALLVGSCLGAVVGASNIYLGLKSGFTFGPQLFGAIFGFALIKPLSKAIPENSIIGKVLGGPFGPKENCTVQSAATAAGGLGILFVSAIPALYALDLLSDSPRRDAGKLIALAVTAGFFGVSFVIPLRRYFIIKQRLTFPTPAATAFTIRALHSGTHGAVTAAKKTKGLAYSLAGAFLFKIVGTYAPGITWDWHIGWTLYRLGFTSIIALENYGWLIEFTPAFFGAGMLSGMNASLSFLGGSILAWGIIAPSLVATGKAVVTPISKEYPLFTVASLSFKDPEVFIQSPSPRYWLLWPGVLVMFLYSFADVILNVFPSFIALVRNFGSFDWRGWFNNSELDPEDEDQTPMEDRVPTWWWTIGLAISTIVSVAILSTMFHFNIGEALLALILGFLFSFIGVQSSGATDINPVTTVAKGSQLIFGGIGKSAGMNVSAAQTLNLSAGVVAAGAAAQATDMTGDLKTGYLLRAKPKNQFIAQLVGAVVAVFLNVGLFILFTTASKCIIFPQNYNTCTYSAPSVAAWAAVATAVSSPKLPVPSSSGYTAIGLGVAAVLTVVAKHFLIPKKYWPWLPNWNAVGLGFVLPQPYFSVAMGCGAIFGHIWMKKNPSSFDMYMFPVAAGLLAGEGLGGVFAALLAVAGVDGSVHGTSVGCPGFEYCG